MTINPTFAAYAVRSDFLPISAPPDGQLVQVVKRPQWIALLTGAQQTCIDADRRVDALWVDPAYTDGYKFQQLEAIRAAARQQVETAFDTLDAEINAATVDYRQRLQGAISANQGDQTAQLIFEQQKANARGRVMRELAAMPNAQGLAELYQAKLDAGDLPAANVLEEEGEAYFRLERHELGANVGLDAFCQLRDATMQGRLTGAAGSALQALGELEYRWRKAAQGLRMLFLLTPGRVSDIGRTKTQNTAGGFSVTFTEPLTRFPLDTYYGLR